MTFLSNLATFFGFFIGIGNIPQVLKIFRTKSADDLSIISVSIFFTGALIWVLYGIELRNFPIILTNGLASISLSFVILGWILYGREKVKNL